MPTPTRLLVPLSALALALTALSAPAAARPADSPEEDAAVAAADALVVHGVDEARGNLHLPLEGEGGATVAWSTSDADVITGTGEVTRPAPGEPATTVTLTAAVTVGDATVEREFASEVPPLPVPAAYEGYLFSHFLGEGLPDGEQIYFALSEGNDPLHYTSLNDGEPVAVSESGELGLRDPFLIRSPEGDTFYQIATDLRMYEESSGSWDEVQRQGSRKVVVWKSNDLVNWSESWVAEVAPESAGNAWAPEIFYDEEQGSYVVFWASKVYADDDPEHTGDAYNRMLYSTTRDFRTFSEPATLIDTGSSVIDTTMIASGGQVHRFSKNEADRSDVNPGGKYVYQEVGDGPLDPFSPVSEAIGADAIRQGEGPLVFKSNTEERWYLFIDEYGGRGYVPFTTTDLASGDWTALAEGEYAFDARYRHGTVLPVTAVEHRALQEAYGAPATDADAVAADLAALDIPNLRDVRGNVTLPATGANGSTISWASSDPGVIAPDGVVARPADATAEVTLTATAVRESGGAVVTAAQSREFAALVRPAPRREPTTAYFFPHFKGEATETGEQIHFAASRGNDALSWTPLADDAPVLTSTLGERGLRDPFIIRSPEGDRFYLLATDLRTYREGEGPDFARAQQTGSLALMVWESTDLVNWSEQRMVEVNTPLAGNTWAPEAYWSDELGAYVVYWASNLYPSEETEGRDTRESYNRMMVSTTRDFVSFTEPEVWIDIERGPGRGMIDSTVIEHDGQYYRFTKDERNDIMEVLLERSPDLLRPESGAVGTSWELVTERIGSGDPIRHAEGPTVFRANDGDVNVDAGEEAWFLFQDWPPYGGGDGYVAYSSADLDDPDGWTYEPGLDLSARHGTVLPITQAEWNGLTAAYGDAATGDPGGPGGERPDDGSGPGPAAVGDAADERGGPGLADTGARVSGAAILAALLLVAGVLLLTRWRIPARRVRPSTSAPRED